MGQREGGPGNGDRLAPPGSAVGMPPWAPRLVILAILFVGVAIGAIGVIRELRGLISNLIFAMFLSFALEPAVNWLHGHGWRRGLATGVVLFALLVVGVLLIGLMIPIVIKEIGEFIQALPGYLDRLAAFAKQCCNVDLSTQHLTQQLQGAKTDVARYAGNIAGNLLGFCVKVLGAIFNLFTIGLFTFYFVADGPRVRRAICSLFPPSRQRDILWAWETAIEKTGGYFYSRLLLAVINGSLILIVMAVLGVPFALPLAVFEGLTAEFIPVVGTYIAGIFPVLIALTNSWTDAVVLVIYIAIYQQVENYVLSPRLSARTMELNAGIAFGAALAGGSIGGVVGAFLALPAAAVIQAFVSNYIKRYNVVESELTLVGDAAARSAREPKPASPGWRQRILRRKPKA
jgi:predicted PurR-regulated permease PerM